MPYWRLSALVGWLVFIGILCGVWWWLCESAWVPYVLAAVVAWAVVHVIVMPGLRYRVQRWEVTPVAVRTRTGWLNREECIAPLSRIQTVDSTQGALMRVFGLAAVTVTTASSAGPVVIDGLAREPAERVVAELTAATAATPGDAT